MTADERARELAEQAATRAVEQVDPTGGRRRRLAWIAAAVLAVCLLGGGAWVALKFTELQGQVDANAHIARQLGDQVEQLGGTPVVQPPTVDDPDPNDPDPDDPERQDAEVQDPEIQDGEQQDSEVQDPEVADVEHDDPDPDDPEIQDPEIDDPPVPGPQGPAGPPGPTCPAGYTAASRTYDPTPLVPGDEETWWVCVADGQGD